MEGREEFALGAPHGPLTLAGGSETLHEEPAEQGQPSQAPAHFLGSPVGLQDPSAAADNWA